MKLTKQQIEYAFERIDGIVAERVKAKSPAEITDTSRPLSTAQKRKQIEDGVAKLKTKASEYTYWPDAFDFVNAPYEAWQAKVAERNKKIETIKQAEKKKAQKVKDKIMLSGDAEAALQLVEQFAGADA